MGRSRLGYRRSGDDASDPAPPGGPRPGGRLRGGGTGTTDLSDQAEDVAEQTRFCLSLARTLHAIEEGDNVATAVRSAEETLAQAPTGVESAAGAVVDHLRRAAEGDTAALQAPSFEASVDALGNDGRQECDPTDPGP